MRVHPEILAKQKLPPQLVTKNIWRERFEDISAFERYLARNGTVILKFFLNVSKEEQRQRFLDRLEEPAKNWKFSMGDVAERALWDKISGGLSGRDPPHLDAAWRRGTSCRPTTNGSRGWWSARPSSARWKGSTCISRKSTRRIGASSSRFGGAAGGGEGDEKVGWVERKRNPSFLRASNRRVSLRSTHPTA